MAKRKNISTPTETDVFSQSARRCCICFGLNADFEEKKGQISHLDQDSSNNASANLAFLCLEHHDEYDSKTSQSKGLTLPEVKGYRSSLYEAVTNMRDSISAQSKASWPSMLEVPLLTKSRQLEPVQGSIQTQGIQFIDKDPTGKNGYPLLYLSIYFKTSRYFGSLPPSQEKWLYFEAHMRPAFSLRVQVRAWNNRDVSEFIKFLRNPESNMSGYELQGHRPANDDFGAGDYLLVWRENGENKLTLTTFTATNAWVSIQARFSSDVANAFADYLDEIGFAKHV